MPSLSALVRAHIEEWNVSSVEMAVFGTDVPEAVAEEFEAFCRRCLGSPVEEALFYGASAGCTAGLRLHDGRSVVVKAYQDRWRADFLGAVGRVQEHLSQTGFPCPRPVAGPERAGAALATAETFVLDPGMRVFGTPEEMAASAAGLSRQIDLCRGLDEPNLAPHPLDTSSGALYPEPHNPLFDFSLGVEEAGWIDELAMAAKAARDADLPVRVIGHTDWSARNVRLGPRGVVAAYDWDSLALVAEPVVVGHAAATWRSTGEADDPIAPAAGEVRSYLRAYEVAAGRRFSADETKAAMGAALWVLAYSARCEHALQAVTGKQVERARARLRVDSHSYLVG